MAVESKKHVSPRELLKAVCTRQSLRNTVLSFIKEKSAPDSTNDTHLGRRQKYACVSNGA